MRVFRCNKCKNTITFLTEKTACTPMCCGEEMVELKANTTDAATEKHVPVVEVNGSKVTVCVGEVEHPMAEEHYIQFIILETDNGYYKADLKPGDKPMATFVLPDGVKAIAAYELCNLHGFWKKDL